MRSAFLRPALRALAVAAVLPLAACGIGEKTFKVKKTISVSSDTETAVAGSGSYDLSEEKEYADLKDIVTDVEIVGARVRVTNPNTNGANAATRASGTATVVAGDKTFTAFTYDLPVTQDAEQEVTLTPDAANALRERVLSDDPTFTVSAAGNVDAAPAYFNFQIELDVKATFGFGAK